jgi:hypothetical protein
VCVCVWGGGGFSVLVWSVLSLCEGREGGRVGRWVRARAGSTPFSEQHILSRIVVAVVADAVDDNVLVLVDWS